MIEIKVKYACYQWAHHMGGDVAKKGAKVPILSIAEVAHFTSLFKIYWGSRECLRVLNIHRGSIRDTKFS